MSDSRPPIKERIEGNRSILKFRYLILLIAGLILIESCILANQMIQTTTVSQANPTLESTSCGVGEYNTNIAIWIEGQKAKQSCNQIMLKIRGQGGQPYAWNGRVDSTHADRFWRPVCSDVLPGLSYEVIEVDYMHYGTEWCVWMVETFGGSSSPTRPDLFNITTQARQTQEAYIAACKQHYSWLDEDTGVCVYGNP